MVEATILTTEDLKKIMTRKRREILGYLSYENPESISELAEDLGRDRTRVTKDLDILQDNDIITYKKEGQSKKPILKNKYIATEPLNIKKLSIINNSLEIPYDKGVSQGIDGHDNKVRLDRWNLEDLKPNSITIGRIGSGKTYRSKIESIRTLEEYSNKNIIVIDPLRSFQDLMKKYDSSEEKVGDSTKIDIFKENTKNPKLKKLLIKELVESKLDLLNKDVRDFILKIVSEPLDSQDLKNKNLIDILADKSGKNKEEIEPIVRRISKILNNNISGEEDFEIGENKLQVFSFSDIKSENRTIAYKIILERLVSEISKDNEEYLVILESGHIIDEESKFLEEIFENSNQYGVSFNLLIQHIPQNLTMEKFPLKYYHKLNNLNDKEQSLVNVENEFVENLVTGVLQDYSECLFKIDGNGRTKLKLKPSEKEKQILDN